MRCLGPVLAAFVLVAVPASAYTIKGVPDCARVVEGDRDAGLRQMNKAWLMGYITARNYAARADVGRGVDNDQIYAVALAFCEENPGRDWDDAAIYIYDRLQ